MERAELEELYSFLDGRYVKRADCDDRHQGIVGQLADNDKRLAVIELQQKINNWLTTAIVGGIVALLIKVYLGG